MIHRIIAWLNVLRKNPQEEVLKNTTASTYPKMEKPKLLKSKQKSVRKKSK